MNEIEALAILFTKWKKREIKHREERGGKNGDRAEAKNFEVIRH